jgi:hypothetical protein
VASIQLSDGRVVPIVKPHVGDQMELERQMRSTRKGYGPKEFHDDLKLSSFGTAFALFATLNRAGVPTTIQEVLELDLDQLGSVLKLDPSESFDDDNPAEVEGEKNMDPQSAETVAAAVEA